LSNQRTGEEASPACVFDGALLVARRDRFAAHADDHDFLLRRVGDDFAERLAIVQRTFERVFDIGAHHGVLARRLAGLQNVGDVISIEASGELLSRCPRPRLAGDNELLPIGEGQADLVISALSLQLVNDLPGSLAQVRRALRPDGLFLGALLGAETLRELRHAWAVAEEDVTGGISPRVAPMVDVRSLGSLLQRAQFALPVVDSDLVTVTYASALELMREVRVMGGGNILQARRRRPVTRSLLARVCAAYEQTFAGADGRVPATFEILTATAWSPHESQQKPLRPGSAQARLADALGAEEISAGEKPERKT